VSIIIKVVGGIIVLWLAACAYGGLHYKWRTR